MKLFLTCCFYLITVQLFAQDWGNAINIDTLRDKNGKIVRIENRENSEDISFDYYPGGGVSKMTFTTRKNGIQYEKVTDYFANGTVARISFYYILDKKIYGKPELDSTYSEYDTNGAIKEKRFYVKGKENGKSFIYYQDGKVEAEMDYMDGKLINIKYFDNKGNALNTGDFKDGNGRLIIYKNGVQVSICTYKNGEMIKRTCGCN